MVSTLWLQRRELNQKGRIGRPEIQVTHENRCNGGRKRHISPINTCGSENGMLVYSVGMRNCPPITVQERIEEIEKVGRSVTNGYTCTIQ